jgi:hypothetical protein
MLFKRDHTGWNPLLPEPFNSCLVRERAMADPTKTGPQQDGGGTGGTHRESRDHNKHNRTGEGEQKPQKHRPQEEKQTRR